MRLGLNLGYLVGSDDPRGQLRLTQHAAATGFSVVWASEAYGSDSPIQRVPSGLPGPGGTGSESFAHGDGGGYHHGLRCMFTISKSPTGVGYADCPVATPNQRTNFASSK